MRDFLLAKSRGQMLGKASLRQELLANTHHLLGLDHGLQAGVGFGLARFKAEDGGARSSTSTETRYFVPIAELPPLLQASAKGRVRRSCTFDASTKSSRLEVFWDQPRDALITFLDQGSVGWHSKHWLFLEFGCRGWFYADPAHRRYEQFLNAVNMGSGPWGSCAHFGKYSEAAAEYFSNMSSVDALFQELAPLLAFRAFDGKRSFELPSDELLQTLWDMGRDHWLFQNKGAKAQQNRWFQWTRRWRDIRGFVGFLLLALMYQGLTLGWWATLEDSPLQRLLRQPEPAGDAGPQGGPHDGSEPPAPSSSSRGGPAALGQVDASEAAADSPGGLVQPRPRQVGIQAQRLASSRRHHLQPGDADSSRCDHIVFGADRDGAQLCVARHEDPERRRVSAHSMWGQPASPVDAIQHTSPSHVQHASRS